MSSASSFAVPIAVIGIGCRYPDADTPRKLWENILARRRQFRRLPDCRLPLSDYYDADKRVPDKTYGRQAAVIDGFEFDWAGRRIPLSTVRTTDIVHWLALETCLAAVADAGYAKESLPGKGTGVIVGNTLTGEQTRANTMRLRWPFVRRALAAAARDQGMPDEQLAQLTGYLKERYTSVFPPVDEDTLAGGLSNTIAGRICNHLDLMGGGFTVDGACSSSLLAVAQAAARLCDGELELAIVGGVDISLDPFELIGFAKTGALTDGEMTVYDRGGKGFIPGEGCGFMVLKPLDAAQQDENRIYAVLHGWGISSDGGGTGITAPSVSGQALAIQRAYQRAPHTMEDLDFIEGHGTGTTVGDRTELEAIATVLGRSPVSRGQLRPCGITSLKSIIGHTKAASGIGGLIKAVMALNRRVIPPTAACRDPHQAFDAAARRLYPVRQGARLPDDRKMVAGVSSMGFGGINCHLTLSSGDGPDGRLEPGLEEEALLAHAQESEVVALGADSQDGLLEQLNALRQAADGISVSELADLSAHWCRQASPGATVRAAVVAAHPEQLATRLELLQTALHDANGGFSKPMALSPGADIWIGAGDRAPRVGLLFPGQGSGRINMARTLVQRFAWARRLVQQADEIAMDQIGMAVSDLIYRDVDRVSGPEERDRWFSALARTEHAQPAICLASMIWFEWLTRIGVVPAAVGGHSLGELGAWSAGGLLGKEDLLRLATLRGQAMAARQTTPGTMAGLRCDVTEAEEMIAEVAGTLVVANRNSPHQTVVSGEEEAIDFVVKIARARGIDARRLPVSGAFHSPLCEPAARKVAELAMLAGPIASPGCALISSIDGQPLVEQGTMADYFSRQMRSQVNFIALVQSMAARCDLLLEVGPGRVLTALVTDVLGPEGPVCLPVEGQAQDAGSINRVLAALYAHGQPIHWDLVFDQRLIRPFVPAAERNFIASPCESLPPADAALREAAVSPAGLPAVLADAFAGMPEALVARYLESRGGFLNQVVQADLSYWDADARPGAVATPPSKGMDRTAVVQTLFEMVAETTGFAADSLSPDARLLDDLNLDSIKAGDLIARFADTCHVAFPDPALLANASLAELTDAAAQLMDRFVGEQRAPDRQVLENQLIGLVAETTGFAAEGIDPSMRLLDDLNLDSIKAGDLIVRMGEVADADRLDVQALANASLGEVVDQIVAAQQSPAPDETGAPDALAHLLGQAALITGFAGDDLDADLELERDLHMGADKIEPLVRRTAAAMGIQAHLDIEPLRGRTLRQISGILARMATEQQAVGQGPAVGDGHPTWVRNFVLELAPTPYPPFPPTWRMRQEDDWQTARVLVVHHPTESDLAAALTRHLHQRGAAVTLCGVDEEAAGQHVADSAYSHLVAIVPKADGFDGDAAGQLAAMIRMRTSVINPPPAADAPRRRTTVAWVQFGGGFFGRDPRFADPVCSASVALGASVHLERADLRVRVIDFCPGLTNEVIAWETVAELTTTASFAAVGYDRERTRRTLVPHLLPSAHLRQQASPWSPEDVVLVTGGAKGITAACALAVARQTGVRMALVGSSPHPDAAPADSAGEIRQLLDEYARQGLTADYFTCDVADGQAVAELVETVAKRLGPVAAIIHGAGINRPRTTGQVPADQAFSETAPKVLGLMHLLDAVAQRPPRLIMGMGSIIGITGMPGNGWYGFSNEVMDIALRAFAAEHPETRTVNLAYSIWRDAGMGARMGSVKLLADKGIDAIPTAEGVARFVDCFTHDSGRRQVVVAARMGGLDTWHQELPAVPDDLRFLEHRLQITPGVEVFFGAHLTLETDPYLKDHNFSGSYLFPTVFGLEAMAQAAMTLAAISESVGLRIENVLLARPITVDPEKGADIVIRTVLEETPNANEIRVHAGIAKAGSGVAGDHFAATFVFAAPPDADHQQLNLPDQPLPMVPATDLYRPTLLFQGPLFQGIEAVWSVKADTAGRGTALFSSRVRAAGDLPSLAFSLKRPNRLCLGDPFFNDTLLQSAALLVPQDTSLPISIERLELHGVLFAATTPATVKVELMGREDRDLVYEVVAVGQEGQVRAHLHGYRLRILQHHDDYPTVADLLEPTVRDRQLLGQAVDDACRDMLVQAPAMEIATIPGIHAMEKEQRHGVEEPLLKAVLDRAVEGCDLHANSLQLQWQANGKPAIIGMHVGDLDVSLSHEDRTCLAMAGPGPLGCDLAAVTERSREQWEALLGARRVELLERLVADGETVDAAGTRIWAAMETMVKAGGLADGEMSLVRREGGAVLFETVGADETRLQLLTLPLHLTWGAPLILALTVADKAVPRVPEHLLTANYPGYEPLYETQPFEMIEGGPQGQLVFVQRLPVTFQPSANLSRTIYFSNFIKWMGNTREASAWPVLAEMSEQFASGRWGGVTNYGHLKILGEGATSDQIEVLMWVSDNSGPENSTMTLSYDFRRMLPDGFQRLAFCRLQTTWVEILGPGVAKVAPYPAYYGQFIEDMCPRFAAPDDPEPLPESLAHLFDETDDAVIYEAPAGPQVEPIVREQTFETTLAQANLVGNIYYANYYEWQGQIRDRFFYELIPEYYGGIGERGELLTLESRVDHLREAMPFDRILLTLAIKELRSCRVTFQVDYFRQEPDGQRVKLAHGLHRAVWTLRDNKGLPQARPFPKAVQQVFEKAINGLAG